MSPDLPRPGTLEYDLAVALHSGCALILGQPHELNVCPTRREQLIYANKIVEKLEANGHILTMKGLADAIHKLEYDRSIFRAASVSSGEMAEQLWEEMHASR